MECVDGLFPTYVSSILAWTFTPWARLTAISLQGARFRRALASAGQKGGFGVGGGSVLFFLRFEIQRCLVCLHVFIDEFMDGARFCGIAHLLVVLGHQACYNSSVSGFWPGACGRWLCLSVEVHTLSTLQSLLGCLTCCMSNRL
jgi:hypothetical protein